MPTTDAVKVGNVIALKLDKDSEEIVGAMLFSDIKGEAQYGVRMKNGRRILVDEEMVSGAPQWVIDDFFTGKDLL